MPVSNNGHSIAKGEHTRLACGMRCLAANIVFSVTAGVSRLEFLSNVTMIKPNRLQHVIVLKDRHPIFCTSGIPKPAAPGFDVTASGQYRFAISIPSAARCTRSWHNKVFVASHCLPEG